MRLSQPVLGGIVARRAGSGLAPCSRAILPIEHPDHALLRNAGDQAPVTAIDRAADVAARAAGPAAVRDVEQPFVRTKIVVEPDRVVEAGLVNAVAEPTDAVRQRR